MGYVTGTCPWHEKNSFCFLGYPNSTKSSHCSMKCTQCQGAQTENAYIAIGSGKEPWFWKYVANSLACSFIQTRCKQRENCIFRIWCFICETFFLQTLSRCHLTMAILLIEIGYKPIWPEFDFVGTLFFHITWSDWCIPLNFVFCTFF